MNADHRTTPFPSSAWPLATVIATTLFAIAVSVYYLRAGQFNVFQNLFYFPIIVACVFYLKRGFVFSLLLVFLYVFLLVAHTADAVLIQEALIRAVIFMVVAGVVAFISQRYRWAAEEICMREEQYRNLVEKTSDWVWAVDQEGRYTYVSPKVRDILGYESEEVIGKTPFELMPPDEGRKVAQVFSGYIAARKPFSGMVNINLHRDGRQVFLETSGEPVFDARGTFIGYRGIDRDITERRRVEERLAKEMELKSLLTDLYEKEPALTDKELYDYVLDHVVRLTDSTMGFFHLVSDDQKEIILTAWNAEALGNCTVSYASHYPIEQAGNWVDCVRLKAPVVYNDFPHSPHQNGFPEGHPPVKRFMSVPAMEGDKVRIIFGVGNKAEEYSELDAVQIQVVANDLRRIMAQRRMEAALSRSEARFRSLIENASDIITILNADGTVRYMSPSVGHVAGYPPSELTDQDIFSYIHLEDLPAAAEVFTRAVQNPGDVFSGEFRLRHRDGSWHVYEIVVQNLLDDEAVKGVIVNSRDVTDRKEKTAEIEMKSLLLDSAIDSIFMMDLEGRFLYVNESAYKSRGYGRDELMAINLRDLDDPAYQDVIPARFKEIVEKGTAIFESAHLRKDGSVIPVEVHSRLMEMKGQKYLFSIIRDISERKKAEEELRKAYNDLQETKDQLIQSGRLAALGQLASGAAHEIRNPLHIISLSIQMLDQTEPLTEKTRTAFGTINAQIARIVKIIDGLRTFSNLSPGEKEQTDIHQVIDHVLRSTATRIKTEHVSVETAFQSGLPWVSLDAKKMEQALLHILNNALDAVKNHDEKKISIRTSLVPADLGDRWIRIVISDTGHGIREEDLLRLFDPFFTTKGPDKGTGLGLSIAYSIIHDHGGRIWAENNEEGGASFFIELPVGEHSARAVC